LQKRLKKLNPAAPIFLSDHGAVDVEKLIGVGLYDPKSKTADVRRWLNEEAYLESDVGVGHHDDHDHDGHDHGGLDRNRHDDHIRATCLSNDTPLDWDRFVSWIEMLTAFHGAQILRVKGVLNVEGEGRPIAIHGVQHLFHPPALLAGWPDPDRRSRIVFITRDLGRDFLEESFRKYVFSGQ